MKFFLLTILISFALNSAFADESSVGPETLVVKETESLIKETIDLMGPLEEQEISSTTISQAAQ